MTIQVYPEPTASTGAGLPYGASTKVIDGESATGTYTYASAVPAGDYVFSAVSLTGNGIGATAYSATLGQTVTVADSQNEYFQTTGSASDWKFTALGTAPTTTATPIITQASPSGNSITSLAVGGGKMVAGVAPGIVSVSNNATLSAAGWTETNFVNSGNVYVSYGNSRFFFGGGASSAGNRAGASTDGVTWTTSELDRYSAADRTATRFVNDRFFYVGNRGFVAHSTDGTSWSYISGMLPQTNVSYALIYNNGKFIQAGSSGIVNHSTTGVGWTRYATPITTTILTMRYLNGLYVGAGQSGNLITSTDAITWTSRTSSFGTTDIQALTYGNGVYVAGGVSGQLRTSTDAITWTSRTPNFGTSTIFGLAYGAGAYVAVGAGGTLTSSTDGITWTTRTSQFGTSQISAVEFINNLFVAGGAGGRVSSSTDGITWTGVNSGAGTISSLTYANGRYIVASSAQNNSYQSTDLVTWTLWALTGGVPDNTISTLRGIASNGAGTIIAAGTGGDIIGSTDGITWNKNYPSVFSETVPSAINHDGTNYVVTYNGGANVAKSTDLVTWTYNTASNNLQYVAFGTTNYVGAASGANGYHLSTDAITWGTSTVDAAFQSHNRIDFADGYFWRSGYAPTTTYPVFARSGDSGSTWTNISWGANETVGSDTIVTRNSPGWILNANKGYYQYITTTTASTMRYTIGTGRTSVKGVVATTSNIIISVTGYSYYSDALTPTTFTQLQHPSAGTTTNYLAYGNGTTVYGLSNATYYSTNNGATLTTASAVVSNSAAYSTTNNMWVLAMNQAGLSSALYYSLDNFGSVSGASVSATNANGTAASTTAIAYSVAARDGWFLAGFDEGAAAWSDSGTNYVAQKPVAHSSTTFYGAAIGNGKGVLVGNNGTIMVSDAGSHNWKTAGSVFGPSTTITDIGFNNGTFLAVGDSKVATSTDGVTWTLRTGVTGTGYNYAEPFYSVTPYGDTDFLLGAEYGAYRTTNTNSPTAFRLYQVSLDTLS